TSGAIPLPPYIRRAAPEDADLTRYQTIYAERPGAVAAPTAGLHFTPAVVESLERAGVRRARLTLHVGYGTFRPIQVENLEDHRVDGEEFEVTDDTCSLLNRTRNEGGRIVAVGTTSARVLETQYRDGRFEAGRGETHKYIFPPYEFHGVDALQTNFHLPESSLLALVCAFAGAEFVLEAYRNAVAEKFRFYSYGDVMLIL
ncbi:MAG: S-adenosylmethionine:tRNA ribosyltransferase-isomerase, partial [Candidatus Hydrogenedentes bacterium]|nr:S-adenosylmethionine:tRNA ribosyltransferase-isomerase [Candidatus Hydrogenedentota bacterium]